MVDSIAAASVLAQAAEKAEWRIGELERWRGGKNSHPLQVFLKTGISSFLPFSSSPPLQFSALIAF
jgi:hypothetical protein